MGTVQNRIKDVEDKLGGDQALIALDGLVKNFARRLNGDSISKATQSLDYLINGNPDKDKAKIMPVIGEFLGTLVKNIQDTVPACPDFAGIGKQVFHLDDYLKKVDADTTVGGAKDTATALQIAKRTEKIPLGNSTLKSYLNGKLEDQLDDIKTKIGKFLKDFKLADRVSDFTTKKGQEKLGKTLTNNQVYNTSTFKQNCNTIKKLIRAGDFDELSYAIPILELIARESTRIPLPTDDVLPIRNAYFNLNTPLNMLEERAKTEIPVDDMRNATLAELNAREAIRVSNQLDNPLYNCSEAREYLSKAVDLLEKVPRGIYDEWFAAAPWKLVQFLFSDKKVQRKYSELWKRVKAIRKEAVTGGCNKDFNKVDPESNEYDVFKITIDNDLISQPLSYQVLTQCFDFKKGSFAYNGKNVPAPFSFLINRNQKVLDSDPQAKLEGEDILFHEMTAKILSHSMEKVLGFGPKALNHLSNGVLRKHPTNQRVRRETIEKCQQLDDIVGVIHHCKEYLNLNIDNEKIKSIRDTARASERKKYTAALDLLNHLDSDVELDQSIDSIYESIEWFDKTMKYTVPNKWFGHKEEITLLINAKLDEFTENYNAVGAKPHRRHWAERMINVQRKRAARAFRRKGLVRDDHELSQLQFAEGWMNLYQGIVDDMRRRFEKDDPLFATYRDAVTAPVKSLYIEKRKSVVNAAREIANDVGAVEKTFCTGTRLDQLFGGEAEPLNEDDKPKLEEELSRICGKVERFRKGLLNFKEYGIYLAGDEIIKPYHQINKQRSQLAKETDIRLRILEDKGTYDGGLKYLAENLVKEAVKLPSLQQSRKRVNVNLLPEDLRQ